MNHMAYQARKGRKEADRTDAPDLTHQMIGLAIKMHRALGPSLLEEIYQECPCWKFPCWEFT